MDFNKFKDRFHPSWRTKIKPFIESEECDEIFKFLKSRKEEGINIAPSSFCLFRCFKQTPLDELKCVVIGENPFNIFEEGSPIDTGVLFESNRKIETVLQEFFNGIEKDLYNGLNLNVFDGFSLDYLTSQGVLMLPSSLTIEENAEKGHNKIWKPFLEFLLIEIISTTKVPILFLGRSKQYLPLVEKSNYCYSLDLPKFGNIWDTKNTFKSINSKIWESNGDTIMWLNLDVPF